MYWDFEWGKRKEKEEDGLQVLGQGEFCFVKKKIQINGYFVGKFVFEVGVQGYVFLLRYLDVFYVQESLRVFNLQV